MATQGDTLKCFLVRCNGVVTYHEKLDIREDGMVVPSDTIGVRPHPDYSGWLCDTCKEAFWERP